MNDQDANAQPVTYRDAGVDIDAGESLVRRIRDEVATTHGPEVMGGIGGFGGLFALPPGKWKEPVLVSGTDGVGTKLKLAGELGRHDSIGIDLVGMCVNDVIVTGAQPLFFLDYFATGHLDVDIAESVVRGIVEGCRRAECALIGGETAEMPGMYAAGDYDVAGFCVGVVERSELLIPDRVSIGDTIIGVASSGPHSNGYSLIRRLLEQRDTDTATTCGDTTLADALMAPTRIYVRAIRHLLANVPVHALAHITGGGLPENLPRVLPRGTRACIDADTWAWPPVFDWIAGAGEVESREMLRTFNCGIGMAVVVAPEHAEAALEALRDAGERAVRIGTIDAGSSADGAAVVDISNAS